jgi:hypothetical protein
VSAVEKSSGFRVRILHSDDHHNVRVQYTTGWMAGRKAWLRTSDIIIIS